RMQAAVWPFHLLSAGLLLDLNRLETTAKAGMAGPARGGECTMISRLERTPFAAWWWTVDRLLLAALLALMLGGIILSLAASPPVAARLGLDPLYFLRRQVLSLTPAHGDRRATSLPPPRPDPLPGPGD